MYLNNMYTEFRRFFNDLKRLLNIENDNNII